MAELISGWMVAVPSAWLTLQEAAAAFGCTVRTIKRRVAAGKLRAKIEDGACYVLHPDSTENAPLPAERTSSNPPRRRSKLSA